MVAEFDETHCEKIISSLFKKGMKVDPLNDEGKTPLFIAAYKGKHHLLRILIKRGADVGIRDKAGNTALHFASTVEAATLLLEAFSPRSELSSFINHRNNQHNTPLHSAFVFFGDDLVRFLRSRGADDTIKNKHGNTPQQSAWAVIKKISFPFSAKDESFPECGGLYISKVN